MLGLRRGTVKLVSYKPAWAVAYLRERKRLRVALHGIAQGIEHIGSTAVPGICAKPLIDMMVGLNSLRDVAECRGPLQALGYGYRGSVVAGERLFVKGPDHKRTHYLHIIRIGSRYWSLHLKFRDYLRKHDVVAQEYATLKRRLAVINPRNRPAYNAGKEPFIRNVLRAAAGRARKPRQ